VNFVGRGCSSCASPISRNDLEAGVAQPLNDEISRGLGVEDFVVKVGAAEQIDQNIARGQFSRHGRTKARSMNMAACSSVKSLTTSACRRHRIR